MHMSDVISLSGCPTCYPDRQMLLAGGQKAEQLYARTQYRAFELEQQHGLEVHTVWECEWKQKLRRHPDLRLLDTKAAANVPWPMDLRKHALFGGRVEPFTLFYKCDPEEEDIIVLDIVSSIIYMHISISYRCHSTHTS